MASLEPITERRRPEHADLDLRGTRELVELINDEDARVAPAVRLAAGPLADAIDELVLRLRAGGRLVYVGAGSSGRLAQLDAAECGPTFGVPADQVAAVVAGGDGALPQEAAEDDDGAGAADLETLGVAPADTVVAVSASGATPYVLGAARAARAAGALVVAVCCAEGSELGALADREIVVPVGPEVIAGSTRMKAGTAQKLVLNTISTVVMVRLGRTYGNLMVDVVAGNEKLRARARRAVALAAGVSDAAAAAALDETSGDVKAAIVSLLAGVDATTARARLDAADGSVREALA
jgi:N-acetylmuramic acid 6-phosphate etherase